MQGKKTTERLFTEPHEWWYERTEVVTPFYSIDGLCYS